MYLTLLKPYHTKENVNALFNDRQQLHKKIQEGFGCRREESNSLYTIIREGRQPYLLLSSSIMPKKIDGFTEVDSLNDPYSFIKNESIVQMEAILSPSKSFEGKRHYINTIEDRIKWVDRQMKKAGATMIKCNEVSSAEAKFYRKESKKMISQCGYKYNLILKIEDSDVLKKHLEKGIGSGKAYGFGLLKVITVLV